MKKHCCMRLRHRDRRCWRSDEHRRRDGAGPEDLADDLLGREEALVKPIIDRFTQDDRNRARRPLRDRRLRSRPRSWRRAGTAPPTCTGRRSRARSALSGAAGCSHVCRRRPSARLPSRFSTPSRRWVGTSGRSRVLVYNTSELQRASSRLPSGTSRTRRWKGKIGVAPTNASFQAFVGATINLSGEQRRARLARGPEGERRALLPEQHDRRAGRRPRVTSKSGS